MEHAGPPQRQGLAPSAGASGSGLPAAGAAPSASIDVVAGSTASNVTLTGDIQVPVQVSNDLNEGRLLTPAEVASLFGVDPRTVSRWSDRGVLKAIFTPGGHRRYRYLDVMALRDSLTHRD